MTNQENMVLKNMCFFNIDFLALFFDFSRFWEALGPPKISKKLKKLGWGRFRNAFSFEGGFWESSGVVLGGFLTTF